MLANPLHFKTYIVKKGDNPLALLSRGCENAKEMNIPLFRLVESRLSPTLTRYLILDSVKRASDSNLVLTKLTDPYLSENVLNALQELGFYSIDGAWERVSQPCIGTIKELICKFTSLIQKFPKEAEYFQEIVENLQQMRSIDNEKMILKIEKALWPTKLTDIHVPTYIVPIKPFWAMHLFDVGIARQDLFGGTPDLVFSLENVYYRAKKPQVLESPARILWYVSKGDAKYKGTMSIRASSYLDEIHIDKPKALFSKFRRLGVYKWSDILRKVKNDLEQEIMAFRFSYTEVFPKPISRNRLEEIWLKKENKQFHIQSPISISNKRFFHLYKMGIKNE